MASLKTPFHEESQLEIDSPRGVRVTGREGESLMKNQTTTSFWMRMQAACGWVLLPVLLLALTAGPARAGSDDDGLTDDEEIFLGTNPNAQDTDDDGIPDLHEILGDPTGSEDPDTQYISNPLFSMSYYHPTLTNALGQVFTPPRSLDLGITAASAMNIGSNWAGIALPQPSRFSTMGANGWTFETWVRPSATDMDGALVSYRVATNGFLGAEIGITNGLAYARFQSAGGLMFTAGGATIGNLPLVPDRWQYVAGVWDPVARSLAVYINDAKFARTVVLLPTQGPGAMYLGGSGLTNAPGSVLEAGMMDEVRLWRRAVSGDDLRLWRNRFLQVTPTVPSQLRAYFRFDDAGRSIQDFSQDTQGNTGLNALNPGPYGVPFDPFQDSYAKVFTNVGTSVWVPTENALPLNDFDDADGDGLPNWWEHFYTFGASLTSLNPFDDIENDGLNNLYEFWCRTNPFDLDTDNNGVADGLEDFDGDGLNNAGEQRWLTDPRLPDSDADGWTDYEEVNAGTSPRHPMSRSDFAPGSLNAADTPNPAVGIVVPEPDRFQFGDQPWTVETWYFATQAGVTGDLFTYMGLNGESFRLGLTNGVPFGHIYSSGGTVAYVGGTNTVPALRTNEWHHLALSWSPNDNSFRLFRDGFLLIAQITLARPNIAIGDAYLARGLTSGYIDEFRIWAEARTGEEIERWKHELIPSYEIVDAGDFSGFLYVQELQPPASTFSSVSSIYTYTDDVLLRAYYRFDDGGPQVEDFSRFQNPEFRLTTGMSTNRAATILGADDADTDLLPEWWVDLHTLSNWRDRFHGTATDSRQDLSLSGGPVGWLDGNRGPWTTAPDAQFWPRPVANAGYIIRDFVAFGSIGGVVGHEENFEIVYPKSRVLHDSGLHVALVKYVVLPLAPREAVMNLWVNNGRIVDLRINGTTVPITGTGSTNVAGLLRKGRNQIFIQAEDTGGVNQTIQTVPPGTWLRIDPAGGPAIPEAWPPQDVIWPLATMKIDSSLVVDGKEVIVRGDKTKFDHRAVWHGRASTTPAPVRFPDMAGRFPEHQDFGIELDSDGDQVSNYFEFLTSNNPKDRDTNNNGIPDSEEDFDNDSLSNLREEQLGSDPRLWDTDDDGIPDAMELAMGGNPTDGNSPLISRAIRFENANSGYLELPRQARFALDDWTLEMRIRPENFGGTLLERRVGVVTNQSLINYGMALTASNTVTAYFSDLYGRRLTLESIRAVPTDGTNWTHVAAVYNRATRTLRIYLDGIASGSVATNFSPILYGPGGAEVHAGAGFVGTMNELRLWNKVRTQAEINGQQLETLQGDEAGLIGYYRFDDGGVTAQDSILASRADWVTGWRNAARLISLQSSGVSFEALTPDDWPVGGDLDTDGDGLPDWWEILHGLDPNDPTGNNGADGDPDGDGISNYWEYLLGADPNDPNSLDPSGLLTDADWDSDGDGLTNWEEIHVWKTDPTNPDTDDDGYLDGDELSTLFVDTQYGFSHQVSSPLHSRSPLIARSLVLGGNRLAVPFSGRFDPPVAGQPTLPEPVVVITSPPDGTSLAVRFVTLTGSVSNQAPLQSVRLLNNGAFVQNLALDANGNFEVTTIIFSGANALSVVAVDVDGGMGQASITVTGTFPTADIRVTQTWSSPGDLDTWLVDPQGRHMGWTPAGPGLPQNIAERIPGSMLDIDDIPGVGPENITVAEGSAVAGQYQVWMNNYSHQNNPQSTVRVLVLEGRPGTQFVEFGPRAMPVRDFNGNNPEAWWLVTTITWPAGTMDPAGTPITTAPEEELVDDETGETSTQGWTIEAWVKPMNNQQSGAIGTFRLNDGRLAYQVGLDNNKPFVRVRSAGSAWYQADGAALPSNEWTHVAFVYSETDRTVRLHVNGSIMTARHMMVEPLKGSGNMVVDGPFVSELGATNVFDACYLDELRIWKRARQGGMIQQNMHRPAMVTDSLLAYYHFDDGGLGIEDATEPLLLNYSLGGWPLADVLTDAKPGPDGLWGTADDIPAGPGPDRHNDRVTATQYAPVFGEIDSDDDGIPDWWESLYFGGATVAAPDGDLDNDGLNNYYEYLSLTNPRDVDSDGDGIRDGSEDLDGDGLSNAQEQTLGTHPRLPDTADNGMLDGQAGDANPASSLVPLLDRVLELDGSVDSFVELPRDTRFALQSFTVQAWVNPSAGGGEIVARQVRTNAFNYVLRLTADRRPQLVFTPGDLTADVVLTAPFFRGLPVGQWAHVAGTFDHATGRLRLLINGEQVATVLTSKRTAISGVGPIRTRVGAGFAGLVDEVAIFDNAKTPAQVTAMLPGVAPHLSTPIVTDTNDTRAAGVDPTPGIVLYYRFDDGTSATGPDGMGRHYGTSGNPAWWWGQVEDFAPGFESDWRYQWRNAGTLRGMAQMAPAPADAPVQLALVDSNGDGIPDWWYLEYGLDPRGPSVADEDWDNDGLSNYGEYLVGGDPYDAYSMDPDGAVNDGDWDSDGDGLSNRAEITIWGTNPSNPDTDDDGISDGDEVNGQLVFGGRRVTSPTESRSPYIPKSIALDGSARVLPGVVQTAGDDRFDLDTWTIEAWVNLASDLETGVVLGRETFNSRTNFALRLNANVPVIEFTTVTGTRYFAGANAPIPAGVWTHLAGVWDPQNDALTLYVNGMALQSTVAMDPPAQGRGVTRMGAGLHGRIDEVRVWGLVRTADEIATWFDKTISSTLSLAWLSRVDEEEEDEGDEEQEPETVEPFVVTANANANTLWEALLQEALPAGVTINSVTLTGAAQASGLFEHFPPLPGNQQRPASGIILSSGQVTAAVVPTNSSPNTTTSFGTPGDPDLNALFASTPSLDAVALTVTFTTDATIDGLSFKFIFGSEEFPEWVGSPFNDAFAAFLNGSNISFDSDGNLISVNNNFFQINNNLNFDPGHPALVGKTEANLPLEYDGLTTYLVTSKALTPGTHTLKFVVADASDSILDSAVFLSDFKFALEGGTEGTGTVSPDDEGQTTREDQALLMVAYYTFDDGENTSVTNLMDGQVSGFGAEDHVYPLDSRYAISGVSFDHSDYADLLELRSDLSGDGVADWWMEMYFRQVMAEATDDSDGDGLINRYEYYVDTNPKAPDTDNNGVTDGAEDRDGDGRSNRAEQDLGSDPRLTDTDDDGVSDGVDPHPARSLNPLEDRVLALDGSAGAYVEMPMATRFALADWTVQAWVYPNVHGGRIVARQVRAGVWNYALSVRGDGRVELRFTPSDATNLTADVVLTTPNPIPLGDWTHVAGTFNESTGRLSIWLNGAQAATVVTGKRPARAGVGPIWTRVGSGFNGMIDEVAVFRAPQSGSILTEALWGVQRLTNQTDLVAFYRFDDGTSATGPALNGRWYGTSGHPLWWRGQVEDFAPGLGRNWLFEWRGAGTMFGNVALIPAPASAPVQYRAMDSNNDGIPDWWYVEHGFDPAGPSVATQDSDGDGLSNIGEYLAGTNPWMVDTDGNGIPDNLEDSDGDGINNQDEMTVYFTNPGDPDTDDDGTPDGVEILQNTDPTDSRSPYIVRAIEFRGGVTGNTVVVSDRIEGEYTGRHSFKDWTIEFRVWPSNAPPAGMVPLVTRRVQATGGLNFEVGLEDGIPYARFDASPTLQQVKIKAVKPVSVQAWTHVAARLHDRKFALLVDGVPAVVVDTLAEPSLGYGDTVIGAPHFRGLMHDIRLWKVGRSNSAIQQAMNTPLFYGFVASEAGYLQVSGDGFLKANSTTTTVVPGPVITGTSYVGGSAFFGGFLGAYQGFQPLLLQNFVAPVDNLYDQWTVEAWVRTQPGAEDRIIVARRNRAQFEGADPPDYNYYLGVTPEGKLLGRFTMDYEDDYVDEDGTVDVATFRDYTVNDIRGDIRVDDGRWHHVAYVRNAETVSLYVDGLLDSRQARLLVRDGVQQIFPRVRVAAGPVIVGEDLVGSVDEVRIWNRGLTGQELNRNLDNNLSGTEMGLLSYFTFDYQVGSLAEDRAAIRDPETEYGIYIDDAQRIRGTADGPPVRLDALRVFGRVALAAYYSCDDGGLTLEDYVYRMGELPFNQVQYAGRMGGNVKFTGNLLLTDRAPYIADSDGDQLPDWWESMHGLDPSSAGGVNGTWGDPDGDGLSNLSEYMIYRDTGIWMDPINPDTHGTGRFDFFGWNAMDPTNRYRLFGEIYTDFDSMEDAWEVLHGLDPRRFDSHLDSDGDGWTNLGEFQANISPSDYVIGTSYLPNDNRSYPTPQVTFRVRYKGFRHGGPLIVNAYNHIGMDGVPSATFRFENLTGTHPRLVTTNAPSTGYLREGPNWFFAFYDTVNPNGTWDPGEPAGMAQYPSINIRYLAADYVELDLKESQPNFSQPDYETPGFGRFAWPEVPNANSYRVSIVNKSINGSPQVLSRTIGAPRTYFHEQDFLLSGFSGLQQAGYEWFIYHTVGQVDQLVTNGLFVVSYPGALAQPTLVTPNNTIWRFAENELRWNAVSGAVGYNLQIAKDQTFGASAMVTNHLFLAPGPDASGRITQRVPILAGDRNFGNGTYYWRIQALTPGLAPSGWSATQAIQVNLVDAPEGPYSIRGDLVYFGKVTNANFVVQAFKSRDFSLKPVAQARVINTASAGQWPTNRMSYLLRGLPAGTYYVRAFLDQNNDTIKNSWESSGFFRENFYLPKGVSVPPGRTKMDILIGFADTDNDGIADDWEYQYWGNLTTAGAGSVRGYTDSNNDGLNDYESYALTPMNVSPVALYSMGADGVPIRVKTVYGLPVDAEYYFDVSSLRFDAQGRAVMRWYALPGGTKSGGTSGRGSQTKDGVEVRYQVQYSDRLNQWSDVLTQGTVVYDAASNQFEFVHGKTFDKPGYYRYKVLWLFQ